jgi:putative membrane protein
MLSAQEHAQISAAIAEAEAHTSGEIYVVVAREADPFRLVPVLWAALFAFLLAWLLYIATALSLGPILMLQAAGFVAVALILSLEPLRFAATPPVIADEAVHRAAVAQFMAHGVHLTESRTGVLIYLCIRPRRIELVADSGIHGRVAQPVWDALVADAAAAAHAGRLSEGLLQAIGRVGALLAEHFPKSAGDKNELPNQIVEL